MNTSPAFTEKKTAPMYSGANTDPMKRGAATSPFFSDKKTVPAFAAANTDPSNRGAAMSPMYTENRTSTAYSGANTDPTNRGASASPMFTEKRTSPSYTQSNQDPMNSGAATSPLFTENRTSPSYTTSNISPASSGKSTSPAAMEKGMVSPYAGQNSYSAAYESNSGCPDASGTMPSCAPLAVPYVPFQQKNPKRYNHADALNNGTLYPGLNLPFHLKTDAPNVVNSPLSELQALDFVVHELVLYLDTHPDDMEAFELYKQYAAMAREARMKYVDTTGQLSHHNPPNTKSFVWTNDPWPWNNAQKGWGK